MQTFQKSLFILNLLALILCLSGCGDSGKSGPPKSDVQAAVSLGLPPFLSMKGVETETISSGEDTVRVNFKATVAPKENLYLIERRVAGTPAITLLKLVQAENAESSLYGTLQARKVVDKWSLEKPVIQNGLEQFGSPKVAFDGLSFVNGSPEAERALREQTANAEKASAERRAAIERQVAEQEAIAAASRAGAEREAAMKREEEEKQAAMVRQQEEDKRKLEEKAEMVRQGERAKVKAAEDAERDKLSNLLSEGAEFVGVVSHPRSQTRIRVAFKVTARQGMLVSIAARHPDDPNEKREFHGEIKAVEQKNAPEGAPKPFFAILSPGDKRVRSFSDRQENKWAFWWDPGSFGIRIKNDGSIHGDGEFGEAFFEMQYELTFEKVKTGASSRK